MAIIACCSNFSGLGFEVSLTRFYFHCFFNIRGFWRPLLFITHFSCLTMITSYIIYTLIYLNFEFFNWKREEKEAKKFCLFICWQNIGNACVSIHRYHGSPPVHFLSRIFFSNKFFCPNFSDLKKKKKKKFSDLEHVKSKTVLVSNRSF